MPLIQNVHVQGLWGYRSINLDFDKHVNFLIGPNGSGKTALINLIAGALSGDEALLRHESFESIEVSLTGAPGEIRKIQVTKDLNSLGIEELKFTLDGELLKVPRQSLFMSSRRSTVSELQVRLASSIPLTWLRIDRKTITPSNRVAEGRSNPIDERLANISERLARYFTELQSRVDQEMQSFIRFVFSNLLPVELENEGTLQTERPLPLEASEHALRQIFENFNIRDKRNQKNVKRYFEDLRRINEVLDPNAGKAPIFTPRDFMVISISRNVQAMVREWEKVSSRKNEIYSQRQLFLEKLRNLLQDKEVHTTDRNELEICVLNRPSQVLRMVDLSSGEKQMIVMLSEALLERQTAHIYIADEPELSLHIQWQEVLVDLLTELNPNAQIVFATHSPDVIGRRTQNAFDMNQVSTDATK